MAIEMRLATQCVAKICSVFIEEARQYQNQQGFVQWTKQYPNIKTIREDIQKERGYILSDGQVPFGYLCVDFAGEQAYDKIEGEWLSLQKYAVVHRMAFGTIGRGKNASSEVFRLVLQLCISRNIHSIRVDTDSHNKAMQHILQKEGYHYCGTVVFQGSPKLAYQLDF